MIQLLVMTLWGLACAAAPEQSVPVPADEAVEVSADPSSISEDAVADAASEEAAPQGLAVAEPGSAAQPEAVRPTAVQLQMVRALSMRDAAPPCADVEATSDAPVDDLLWIVQNVKQPPWAGMRAAQCLVEGHAWQAQPSIRAWVGDEATKGLAILALNSLDAMPEDVAMAVAQEALSGPLSDVARPRILRAERPQVRALAE